MTSSLRNICVEYFNLHPKEKLIAIEKGKLLLQKEYEKSHHYQYKNGDTRCWVCDESWYSKNRTRCKGFQKSESKSISSIILDEETLYLDTINRCRSIIRKKYSCMNDISGEEMVILHTTYGCDLEVLEGILDESVPPNKRKIYEDGMERERQLSRSKIKREIINATI